MHNYFKSQGLLALLFLQMIDTKLTDFPLFMRFGSIFSFIPFLTE